MKLPNRTGTICKLSGNRRKPYMVRIYTQDGYRILGYYRLRSEAMTALMTATAHATDPIKSPSATLSEVYDLWKSIHATKVMPTTMSAYANAWRCLKPLHNRPIRHISAVDVEQAILFTNPAPSTRKTAKYLLSQLFRYAMAHDLADRNVADLIDIDISSTPTIERKVYTFPEVAELFASPHPYAKVVLIGIYTGMRPGELLNLKVSEVDLDSNVLRIAGSKTKSGKKRIIPIHPAILSILTELVEKAQNSMREQLFINVRGKPMNIQNLGAFVAKINHTPHDTRHTFATYAHKSGMDSLVVKRILGHSVKDITGGTYTHLDEAILKREIRRFAITQ